MRQPVVQNTAALSFLGVFANMMGAIGVAMHSEHRIPDPSEYNDNEEIGTDDVSVERGRSSTRRRREISPGRPWWDGTLSPPRRDASVARDGTCSPPRRFPSITDERGRSSTRRRRREITPGRRDGTVSPPRRDVSAVRDCTLSPPPRAIRFPRDSLSPLSGARSSVRDWT